ncbi:hypothetical protein GOODEAATRI_021778 [Goodea atripinnis]|uniref:Uncharacterized protein n=1 Tax=Goodea atripinnis TaxID=208336 RepID=A0ABV0N6L9_9TELE
MLADPSTSLLLLQEMQPSLKPLPATASVSESTSAQAPSHRNTRRFCRAGIADGPGQKGWRPLGRFSLSDRSVLSLTPQRHLRMLQMHCGKTARRAREQVMRCDERAGLILRQPSRAQLRCDMRRREAPQTSFTALMRIKNDLTAGTQIR